MKRVHAVLLLAFFLPLLQGCICRHWNLGACREFPDGTCGRIVKIPHFTASVNVFLAMPTDHPLLPHNPDPNRPQFGDNVNVKIQNKDSHIIMIQDVPTPTVYIPNFHLTPVYLKPGEIYEWSIPHNHTNEVNEISIPGVESGAKVEIDILSGRPKGAKVILRAEGCDAI
jgi:hypothetical protein